MKFRSRVDFSAVNNAARGQSERLLRDWLPGGRYEAKLYVALNPTRDDRNLGSFKVNRVTGRWIDFATGDRGSDFISLYAYLNQLPQVQSAQILSQHLEVA